MTWPLVYVGLAVIGVVIALIGWMGGFPRSARIGMFLAVPLLLMIGNLALILSISGLVNIGCWIAAHTRRSR